MIDLLARTTTFASGLDHPEGIATHPGGSVWAGGEAGQIYKIYPEGNAFEIVADTKGFNLGIAFSPGSQWLAICDNGNKCVRNLNLENMQLRKFAEGAEGIRFKIPNYPVFDQDGNLYVSDSGEFNTITGKIFKFDIHGNGIIWHKGPFSFTNGMALDGEKKFLYVVSSWLPGVERILINDDGSAGEKEIYCTLPKTIPDGIAFDANGNLYITCYTPNAIYKVTPDRLTSLLVDDWEAHTLANPTNIAFGGPAMDQLFTANLGRWHINRIDLGIKGLPLVSHQTI